MPVKSFIPSPMVDEKTFITEESVDWIVALHHGANRFTILMK